MRLTRRMRLSNARDFERLFRGACRSSDDLVTVLAKTNGLAEPRLGMAISRRAVSTAVRRNRVKRLIRESFRANSRSLRGLDVVVLARSGVAHTDNAVLTGSLQRHWQAVNKRCKRP